MFSMSNDATTFELPKSVDHYLAALSKLYAQEGKRFLQELVVNAQARIHEAWSTDNWNGCTYGHALYLVIPEPIFLSSIKQKKEIEAEIKTDLNNIHNVQNEFIEEVFLELQAGKDHEWRKESGLLLAGTRLVSTIAETRIWGDDGFRVFLSHKSEVKKETADLKLRLGLFGISSFVAHQDIHPTKQWQDEIENALASMDAFVALMSADFHDSDWTDQEVGFAFARGVPIVAVRLGTDPYGFIGKFQALSSTWLTTAEQLVQILIKNDRMYSAFIGALRRCPNWDSGNILAKALPGIEQLTQKQVDELASAYNETSELRGSFAFNGGNPRFYGPGLVAHLNRLDTRTFRVTADWRIAVS
jgi:hypothetical protein